MKIENAKADQTQIEITQAIQLQGKLRLKELRFTPEIIKSRFSNHKLTFAEIKRRKDTKQNTS